jgi:hypothetical protein
MQEAVPNVSLPFEVSYVPGLYVALNVYNTTTSSPVLVAQVVMSHVFNGTYIGFYSFLANSTYLINISVYTDDTYETVDTDYPPSSATFTTVPASPPSPPCDDDDDGWDGGDDCYDEQLLVNQPYQEYLLGFPQVLGVVVSFSGTMPSNLGVPANELDQNGFF